MKLTAYIKSLSLNTGDPIDINEDDIIAIIGPNNSGKTRLLRELHRAVQGNSSPSTRIVRNHEVHVTSDKNSLKTWLNAHAVMIDNTPEDPSYRYGDQSFSLNTAVSSLSNGKSLGSFANFLCTLATTSTRLSQLNRTDSIDPAAETPKDPLQALACNRKWERKVDRIVREAFQMGIMTRSSGKRISLRCLKDRALNLGEDRSDPDHQRKTFNLPEITGEGDGILSFTGCLMTTFANDAKIVFIDEPEAFLHPPQARHLGYVFARDTRKEKQIWLSTHSGALLRGLMDGNTSRLKILRITRDGEKNPYMLLDTAAIQTLWSDPILRFSNALDSLFHKKVIVCESDTDCRFYSAILDSLADKNEQLPDVAFIPSGGKDRSKVIVKALRELGICITCVHDFDSLRDNTSLESTIESLGGESAKFREKVSSIVKEIEQKSPPLMKSQVRDCILKTIDSCKDDKLKDDDIQQIRASLKSASPWENAKRIGVDHLSGLAAR